MTLLLLSNNAGKDKTVAFLSAMKYFNVVIILIVNYKEGGCMKSKVLC